MKLLLITLAMSAVYANSVSPYCDKKIYCDSKVLHYVQMAQIFPDSKQFVDLHMKNDEEAILRAFNVLLHQTQDKPTKKQLSEFVNLHFDSVSELENWKPTDFNPEPQFLKTIADPKLRQFAKDINNIWPTLGRKVKSIVYEQPKHFSMIPVPNGFIIPGGRFKELYYWDTYWIIEGLLISGMKDTVKGIIGNLIDLQRNLGHVPNGARCYYQERSQPPLLSAMMALYLQETNDVQFLKDNIDALESELEYWLHTHSVVFKVAGREHTMLRYYAPSTGPRPESYYNDYTNAQQFESEQLQDQFYTDIKSAAESGWDFSSRWLINKNGTNTGNLTSVHTTDIIPVDLNAIYANALQNIAHFHSILNSGRKGAHWTQLSRKWINSIKEVLFNQEDGIWYDYDLTNSTHRKYFYISNIAPLWMGVVEPEFLRTKAQLIVDYMKKTHSLEFPGGVPTSLIRTGEQWDFPNAWPPLVSIVVNALEALPTEDSSKLAFEVAQNWVRSMYKGYLNNKQLYEKYDVEKPGYAGAGGEYLVQSGFGWTNGAILEMLVKYGPLMSTQGYLPVYNNYAPNVQQQNTFSTGYLSFNKQPIQVQSHQSPWHLGKPQWNSQLVNSEYSTEAPAKNTYINYASPKPSVYTQTAFGLPVQAKPQYGEKTYPKPEYIQATLQPGQVKPQYIQTINGKPEYIPPTQAKPEYTVTVQSKPEYIPTSQIKPQYVSAQVQHDEHVKPTYPSVEVEPEYVKPAFSSAEVKYEQVKPTYPSTDAQQQYVKPTYPSAEIKPEYEKPAIPSAETKYEQVKPTYPSANVQQQYVKPTYPSAEIKPEYEKPAIPSAETKYEQVKPTYPSANVQQQYVKPTYPSAEIKPEYEKPAIPSAETKYEQVKPTYPSANVQQQYVKPTYPSAEIQLEYVKPTFPSAEVKYEHVEPTYPSTDAQQQYVKPTYTSAVWQQEYVKPTYTSAVGQQQYVKPTYTSAVGQQEYVKPTYSSAEIQPEYVKPTIPSAEAKYEQVKPTYPSTDAQQQYVKPTSAVWQQEYVKPTYTSAVGQQEYVKPTYPSAEIQPEYVKPTLPSAEVKYDHVQPTSPSAEVKLEYVSSPSASAKPGYAYEPTAPSKPQYVSLTITQVKPEYVSSGQAQPEYIASKPEYVPAPVETVALLEVKPDHAPSTSPSVQYKPEYVSVAQAKPENNLPSGQIQSQYILQVNSKPQYVQGKPEVTGALPLSAQAKPEFYLSSQAKPEYPNSGYIKPNFSVSGAAKPEFISGAPAKPSWLLSSGKPISEQIATEQFDKDVYIQVSPSKLQLAPASTDFAYVQPSSAQFEATSPKVSYSTESYIQQSYLTSTSQPKDNFSTASPTWSPQQDEYATSTQSKLEYSTPSAVNSEYSTVTPVEDLSTTTYAPQSEVYPTKPGYGQFNQAELAIQTTNNLPLYNASVSITNAPALEEAAKVAEKFTTPSYLTTTAAPHKYPFVQIKPLYNSSYPKPQLAASAFPAKPVNGSVTVQYGPGAHREPISLSHYSYNQGSNVFNSPFLYSTPAPLHTVYVSSSPVKTEQVSLVPHVTVNTAGASFPTQFHAFSQLVPTHTEQIITAVSEHQFNKSETVPNVSEQSAELLPAIKPLDGNVVTYQLNSKPGHLPTNAQINYSTIKPFFSTSQSSYVIEESATSKPGWSQSLPAKPVFGGASGSNVLFSSTPAKRNFYGSYPSHFGYTAQPLYNTGKYSGQYRHSYNTPIQVKQVNVVSQ